MLFVAVSNTPNLLLLPLPEGKELVRLFATGDEVEVMMARTARTAETKQ